MSSSSSFDVHYSSPPHDTRLYDLLGVGHNATSSMAIRRDNTRVRGPGGRSHSPAVSQVRLRRRRRVRRCYSIAVARRWRRRRRRRSRRIAPVVDDDDAIPRARLRLRRRRVRKLSTIASIASVGVDETSPETDDRDASTTAIGVSRRFHRRADTPDGRGHDRAGCISVNDVHREMRHDEGISARIEDTKMRRMESFLPPPNFGPPPPQSGNIRVPERRI